jgi:molybdopterin converting factor small subunit
MLEFEIASDATVEDVLSSVIEIGGPELERLIMEGARISGNLIVMLNKRDVNTIGGLGVAVEEGDEIAILPHVQGG